MITGVDVSSYQGFIAWPAVRNSGAVQFAYAKASEGTTYRDDTYVQNHDGAKINQIPIGAYHFFHFGEDAQAQADYFLETIDGRQGTLLPMVDVESSSLRANLTLTQMVDELAAFIEAVENGMTRGKKMLLYTGWNFWNDNMGGSDAFAGHPLWIAAYNQDASPPLPGGWSTWYLWQNTSGFLVPGIPGYVDRDVLNPAFSLKDISR